LSKFATLRGTSAAGRSYQEIALQAVEAARKPVDIDDFTRSRRKGVVLLASNETGHASATNANAALTNNEDDSYMATQENSSASSNPQETTHTPGPWTATEQVHPEIAIWADGFGLIARAIYPGEKGRANAHLIAAAPDYHLAATANYGGWIGPELLNAAADHCDDSAIADLLRARATADRAAIAKAKGGAR